MERKEKKRRGLAASAVAAAILLLLASTGAGVASASTAASGNLYGGPGDRVVELGDEDLATTVYNSGGRVTFVQFYAHWCGHCQWFSSTWQELAAVLHPWREHVLVAAVNCALQEVCGAFGIRGTPTLRFFYPDTPRGDLGETVRLERQDVDFLLTKVAESLERVQEAGTGKPGLESIRSFK